MTRPTRRVSFYVQDRTGADATATHNLLSFWIFEFTTHVIYSTKIYSMCKLLYKNISSKYFASFRINSLQNLLSM